MGIAIFKSSRLSRPAMMHDAYARYDGSTPHHIPPPSIPLKIKLHLKVKLCVFLHYPYPPVTIALRKTTISLTKLLIPQLPFIETAFAVKVAAYTGLMYPFI